MRKYSWYFKRLKSMNIEEMIYRIKKIIGNNFEFLTHYFHKEYDAPEFIMNSFFKERIDSIDTINEYNCDMLSQVMDHSFIIFNKCYKFKDTIRWRFDIDNEVESKLVHSTKLNYRNFREVGNVKFVWELNRFQHLPMIAYAYNNEKDKTYLDEVINQMLSWIEQNPYNMGINWVSSLECCFRNISWLITYYMIYDDIEDLQVKKLIEKCIYSNGKYIRKNMSKYSSANNHLIGEALGLVVTAIMFNEKDNELKEWLDYGINILMIEMVKQNYEDGVNKEQGFWYHAAVCDYYIFLFVVLDYLRINISTEYYDLLEKMIEYILYIYNKNEVIPNIGDRDDGYLFKLDNSSKYDYFKSILTSGALMFNRCDFKKYGQPIDNRNRFYFGKSAFSDLNGISDSPIILTDKLYKQGGYAVLFDNKNQVIFDFGNLGYLSIAAHGHADCLSIQLFKNGKAFLIDPGTYCYGADNNRYYFKSTKSHNTVEVDGISQSEYAGPFLWLQKASGNLIDYSSNHDVAIISASHDGYNNIGVDHTRKIYFNKNKFLLIQDTLISDKKMHSYEWNFHINQKCEISLGSNNIVTVNNCTEYINFGFYPIINVKIVQSAEVGWESYSFGEKHPTNTISLSTTVNDNLNQFTIINLDNDHRTIQCIDNEIYILSESEIERLFVDN